MNLAFQISLTFGSFFILFLCIGTLFVEELRFNDKLLSYCGLILLILFLGTFISFLVGVWII